MSRPSLTPDRFVAGTLTAAQIAELAARAADWLHPSWPESVEDADEVGRLLGIARQLFELRDPRRRRRRHP